jgi:hypothetical protein
MFLILLGLAKVALLTVFILHLQHWVRFITEVASGGVQSYVRREVACQIHPFTTINAGPRRNPTSRL